MEKGSFSRGQKEFISVLVFFSGDFNYLVAEIKKQFSDFISRALMDLSSFQYLDLSRLIIKQRLNSLKKQFLYWASLECTIKSNKW